MDCGDLTTAGTPTDASLARCRIKLCDWGLSKHQAFYGWAVTTGLGNATFWAPELVRLPPSGTWDGCKADVWACAIMIFVLLRGAYPHGDGDEELTPADAEERMVNNTFMPPLDSLAVPADSACIELLNGMLLFDVDTRWSIDRALAHRWFNGVAHTVRDEPRKPRIPAQVNAICMMLV